VYGGLAGIAFFLAELCAVTWDSAIERTCRGALTAALALDESSGTDAAAGLYSGRLGVAVVQARIARLMGDTSSLRAAVERGTQSAGPLKASRNPDIVSGKAGGILGLLALAEMSKDPRPMEVAISLGDELIALAVKRGGGLAWGPAEGPWPLTGYAHGASGIAHALAELHARTGQHRFAEFALGALAYEHLAFDPAAGNWPDFRLEPGDPVRPRGQYPTATLWCHGATGVLIALRRISAILNVDDAQIGLRRARKATRQTLSLEIAAPTASWCLCHGVCGNALALVHGGALAPATATDVNLASGLARVGALRYAASQDWPCGVGGGWSPAYMVGVAGAGAFYLSLARPTTPSFVMPIPEAFSAVPVQPSGSRSRLDGAD
jgi:lantibiotic modifying enzyme